MVLNVFAFYLTVSSMLNSFLFHVKMFIVQCGNAIFVVAVVLVVVITMHILIVVVVIVVVISAAHCILFRFPSMLSLCSAHAMHRCEMHRENRDFAEKSLSYLHFSLLKYVQLLHVRWACLCLSTGVRNVFCTVVVNVVAKHFPFSISIFSVVTVFLPPLFFTSSSCFPIFTMIPNLKLKLCIHSHTIYSFMQFYFYIHGNVCRHQRWKRLISKWRHPLQNDSFKGNTFLFISVRFIYCFVFAYVRGYSFRIWLSRFYWTKQNSF